MFSNMKGKTTDKAVLQPCREVFPLFKAGRLFAGGILYLK